MSITQISKIEVRTGLRQNLPQLGCGEFGFCTDDLTLWIGNGNTPPAPFAGNTEIFTTNSMPYPTAGIPSGVQNGINCIFELPGIPVYNTLLVWNNFPLIPNVGYTLLGSNIIYNIAPLNTDSLYFYGYF